MTRTHLTLMLASAALLSALPAPGHTAIFDRDDRHYIGVGQGSPYSPVGLVSDDGLFIYHFQTGFLVDDCHVLTTQSLFGHSAASLGKRAKFQTALKTGNREATRGTVVAAGGLERPGTPEDRIGRNWVLLRLDKCIGATVGHVALSTGPYSPYEFRDLMTAGYPMGRSRRGGLTSDPSCSVIGGRGIVWLNDCASVAGDGGDPIFRMSMSVTKPQMIVYAMQAGGFSSDKPIPSKAGYENRAIPMSVIKPQIEPYLSLGSREKLVAAK